MAFNEAPCKETGITFGPGRKGSPKKKGLFSGVKRVVPAFFELASFLFRSMEAGESLVVAATPRDRVGGLNHAVAVRTGPPEAVRGFSRVNAAPGVLPGCQPLKLWTAQHL